MCVCGGVVSTRHHNAKADLYSGMVGSKDVDNIKSGSLSTVLSYVVSFFAAQCSYKMATLNSYPLSLVMPRRKKETSFMIDPAKVLGFSCTGMNSFCSYLQTTVDKG